MKYDKIILKYFKVFRKTKNRTVNKNTQHNVMFILYKICIH